MAKMIDWVDATPYLTLYTLPSGAKAYHTGADLNLNAPTWDADNNAPVYAIGHGIVTFAERVPTGTWGNLVVIEHTLPEGGKVHSRYGHLRSIMVYKGQAVLRGQQIGTIGGTEFGLPNHLHFDISLSGILALRPTHWPGADKAMVQKHYVHPRNWLAALWGEDTTPTIPPPPAPPASNAIDLLAYMQGDGRAITGIRIWWNGQEHYQQVQTVTEPALGQFFIVKNHMWEQLWGSVEHIYRGADTSYSETEYYVQSTEPLSYGAKWCKRHMVIGEVYRRAPYVTIYNKRSGAKISGPTLVPSDIRLSKHHATWRPNYSGALSFNNVAEMTWLVGGKPAESYWFARDIGLVGWRDEFNSNYAYAVESFLTGQRQPMLREMVVGPAAPYGQVDTSLMGRVRQFFNR